MKYMSFNGSCSYCALANMLEQFNIEITDQQIALDLGLPFLIVYDEKDHQFLAGSKLQGKTIFDLYLKQKGLTFHEFELNRSEIPLYLRESAYLMLGLNLIHGKHAVVFKRYEQGKYIFLNPHREEDEATDNLIIDERELLSMLDMKQNIGYIVQTKKINDSLDKTMHDNSIEILKLYEKKMLTFLTRKQTSETISNQMNSLLRTFALDLHDMMMISQKKVLLTKLKQFREEVLSLRRQQSSVIPSDFIDIKNFKEIIDLYEKEIKSYCSNLNK